MIQILTKSGDLYDEKTQEFVHVEGGMILLEHSLRSLAKWESRWKKPFLSKDSKTRAETIDYIRCMSLTKGANPSMFEMLTDKDIARISNYINDPMTATTFSNRGPSKPPSREIITAELIYYWMVALQIPFECQDWHLNKLLTLIRICEIKNQPKKKQSQREILSQNAKLNAERRKRSGSRG